MARIDDYESATLFIAGQIKQMLGDGEAHYWREATELARELTGGHKTSANRLTWAALTKYIDPHLNIMWGGQPGQRWIAVYDEAKILERAACPACGAPRGHQCWRKNSRGRTKRMKSFPHDERAQAAFEPTTETDEALAGAAVG